MKYRCPQCKKRVLGRRHDGVVSLGEHNAPCGLPCIGGGVRVRIDMTVPFRSMKAPALHLWSCRICGTVYIVPPSSLERRKYRPRLFKALIQHEERHA